jgi:PKD repeat protein
MDIGEKIVNKNRSRILNVARFLHTLSAMKYSMLYQASSKCGLTLLACGFFLASNLSTPGAIVPPERLPPNGSWQGVAGVPGGIPNRTNIFVNLLTTTNPSYKCVADGKTDNLTAIENAINACPSNQVVYLPTGTYYVSGSIRVYTKGYWTLRGDGQGKTIITGGGNGIVSFGDPPWLSSWPATTPIVSGGTRGSTNITVSSTASLAVGQMMWMEQNDDGKVVFGYGNHDGPNADDRLRNNTQCLNCRAMVTGINGNSVTFQPALTFDFNPSLSPDVVGFGATIVQWAGLEDLTLRGASGGPGVYFDGAYACWLKDVELSGWDTFGLWFMWCASLEIRECYVHDPYAYNWSTGYPLQFDAVNNTLIEDNIFWHFQCGLMVQGGSTGNVFGYNCSFEQYNVYPSGVSFQLGSYYANHTPYPEFNLYEGNYGNELKLDFYYGPSSKYTFLRNYITGSDPDITQNRFCISLDSHNWSNNVVGNILGSSGVSSPMVSVLANTTITYANTTPLTWLYDPGTANSFSYNSNCIYRFGYPDSGDNGYGGIDGSGGTNNITYLDATVRSNTIVQGNWDYATKSIVWSPSISDTNIPNSYYLSGKPTWWGNLPWPPYDPHNASAASITNIPAGYRFVYGVNPPSGSGNLPPVAVASGSPASGVAPLTVAFSSAGSSDPEGATLTYNWTFGDGATTTTANPSHTYASAGTYFAQLSVSDGVNTTASGNITITATNGTVVVLPVPQGLKVVP